MDSASSAVGGRPLNISCRDIKSAAPPSHRKWYRFIQWEPQPGAPVPLALQPFRSRFSRLILVCIPVFLLGAIVYAWQLFSGMLFAERAYIYSCSAEDIAYWLEGTILAEDTRFSAACHAQDQRVQVIFNLNMAVELAMGAIAGAALDAWGPFLCALAGHCISLPAILFLAFARPEASWMYTVGATLLGAGCNFVVFPAVTVADYFPARSGLIVSIVIAVQNAGAIVTSLLDLLYRRMDIPLSKIWLVFALAICLPAQILSLLCTPYIRATLDPQLACPLPATPNSRQPTLSASSLSFSPLLCESHVTNRSFLQPSRSFAGSPRRGAGDSSRVLASGSRSFACNSAVLSPPPSNCRRAPPSLATLNGYLDEKSGASAAVDKLELVDIEQPPAHEGDFAGEKKAPSLWTELLTLPMMFYSIFCFLIILAYNYYSVVLREVSGIAVSRVNGYAMPSLALWGVCYGVAVDYVGTLFMSHIVVAIIAVVYIFILTNITILHYIATLLHIVGSACVYTLKFTFLGEFYAPANQGKLLAVLSLVSGLSLLANILCKTAHDPKPILVALLAACPICTALIGAVSFRQTKLAAEARGNFES